MPSPESIRFACQRIEDFATVHYQKPQTEKQSAVEVLMESLEVDDDVKVELSDWLDSFVGPGFDGAIWLGFLLGLYVYQYETED